MTDAFFITHQSFLQRVIEKWPTYPFNQKKKKGIEIHNKFHCDENVLFIWISLLLHLVYNMFLFLFIPRLSIVYYLFLTCVLFKVSVCHCFFFIVVFNTFSYLICDSSEIPSKGLTLAGYLFYLHVLFSSLHRNQIVNIPFTEFYTAIFFFDTPMYTTAVLVIIIFFASSITHTHD